MTQANKPIVTLTGAFKNAGDYLIGDRARTLLRNHTDSEVIDVNRKSITDEHYELFNGARAVLLTGGPAYQEKVFPNVYDLDLSRIKVPVLAFGLGWKGKLGQSPADFKFSSEAEGFVQQIHHDKTRFSSARDHLTVAMLNGRGIENVAMTGCPAWYDERHIEREFVFNDNVKRIVLSMPAVPQAQLLPLMKHIAKLYPRAEKFLSYQAGYKSTHSKRSAEFSRWNYKMLVAGALRGFKPISFEADFAKFENFMGSIDLHVGYRVHSHIFSLSQRKTTMLIAEDSRGVGQVEALGGKCVLASAPASEAISALDELLATHGKSLTVAVATMREKHGEMLRFIRQL